MLRYKDSAFKLPDLRSSFSIDESMGQPQESDGQVEEFFDVKFCPYQPLDCDPVFAVVGTKHTIICKLTQCSGDTNPCKPIALIRDADEGASNCSCTWAKGAEATYICVGGSDAKVKVYGIDGSLVECFVGHGGGINDLATSPVDSSIIASASDDYSVRLWSINPLHRAQPCVCILAGEAHASNLLTVSGRYLLSAGYDQTINLWTIPSLPTEDTDTPLEVHYPHFSTTAIHHGIIDCVCFFGDHILSRACYEEKIVLWRIEGFSSTDPPPQDSKAPTPQAVIFTGSEGQGGFTRSAFVPAVSRTCPTQYTRLLEFHTPRCKEHFFLRFGLHHVPEQNPVLAFCNAAGQVFFWDFARLTAFHDIIQGLRSAQQHDSVQLPTWLRPVIARSRADATSKTSAQNVLPDLASPTQEQAKNKGRFSSRTIDSWKSKYSMEDPQKPLLAHKVVALQGNFVGRQVGWSPGGEWCVVVGSTVVMVLQRWG